LRQIIIEFLIASSFAIYIVIIAVMSPNPPLVDSWFGASLSVTAWVLSQSIYQRNRCLIATRMEKYGQKYLLQYGIWTMVGATTGGILIYLSVDVYRLFKDKPNCT
jgi:hypothetical protein